MRRFLIEHIERHDGSCTITDSEARHIVKVLRMKPGDHLILIDSKGLRFQAIIESIGSKDVRVTIEKPLPSPPSSPIEITLCQSILRSQPMDYTIQKTCELGVHRVIPFISRRTIVKPNHQTFNNKIKHWRKIAQSAIKQSGSSTITEINPVMDFQGMIVELSREIGMKLILWEDELADDLKRCIKKTSLPKKIIGIIGPEGGFSQKEIEIARAAGFISISLGYRILRAETAGVILSAILQYEWGDLGLLDV